MTDEKQEIFTTFMNEFVKLNVNQKKEELMEKQKVILTFLLKYVSENGIQFHLYKSKEIIDVHTDKSTTDDYFEAMMVYLQNIEELIGAILKSNLLN